MLLDAVVCVFPYPTLTIITLSPSSSPSPLNTYALPLPP